MTVTIFYRDGTSEVFTQASHTITGDVVTVVGTDAAGVAGSYDLHWSDIRRISVTP